MKAFFVDRYDKTSPMRLGDAPDPAPGPNDVLVDIHAAALNVLDAKVKSGEFKLLVPYKTPFILGHDLAGVVVAVGPNVRNFKPGDEVYAKPRDGRIGTFAQRIAVDQADVAMKPRNITMEQAASIPLVTLTAWQAFVERAKVSPGQKVFVQAGSGGVGTIAIQLAKQLGAIVATTASEANADLVKSLGADIVVDYRKQDFGKELSGYDVALISQGADDLANAANILKPGGKLISISGPPDTALGTHLGKPLLKPVFWFLSRSIRAKAKARGVDYSFLFMQGSGAQLREITALIESERLRPVVDRVFSFEQTNEAMAYLAQGRAKGKVVLNMK